METFTLYGFGGGVIRGWVTLGLAAMVLIGCQGPSRSASGAASADKPNNTPEKLAEAYVLAVQSHDVARLRALFHPRVLACRNDANAAYFDFLLSHELSDVPRAGYKITTPSLKDDPPPRILPEGMFILPVAPTAQFHIDWNISEYASTTSIRELAPEGGRWYIVFPCPNAEGMKFFEGQLARGKEQQKRAAALAAVIKPALRTELVDLLNRGRKIDAVKKYRAATGADLTTAVQVMNTLQSSTQAQTK